MFKYKYSFLTSIFIATKVPSCVPFVTSSPSLTETFSKVPGIGETTAPDAMALDPPNKYRSFGPRVGTFTLKDPSYFYLNTSKFSKQDRIEFCLIIPE